MYPHEILPAFGTAANQRISISTHRTKQLVIEKSTELQPAIFYRIVHPELKEKGGKMKSFQISPQMGQGVRFLKLAVAGGYEEFSSIHNIVVEGRQLSS